MPWFPVDDSFHSHPKALATSLAARGLWVTAGSWSSAHPKDGVVPDHVLVSLGGTPELAAELVAAGLWRRTRGGYVFHDWLQWGSKRTAEQIAELRAQRAEAGRKGGVASGNTRRRNRTNPEATPKQTLDPNSHSQSPSPHPPEPAGSGGQPPPGGHHGQHKHCRACGTSPRGQPPPPPPGDAARHPSARPIGEAVLAAGLTPSGTPARGDTVHRLAAQARQAITREHE